MTKNSPQSIISQIISGTKYQYITAIYYFSLKRYNSDTHQWHALIKSIKKMQKKEKKNVFIQTLLKKSNLQIGHSSDSPGHCNNFWAHNQ